MRGFYRKLSDEYSDVSDSQGDSQHMQAFEAHLAGDDAAMCARVFLHTFIPRVPGKVFVFAVDPQAAVKAACQVFDIAARGGAKVGPELLWRGIGKSETPLSGHFTFDLSIITF